MTSDDDCCSRMNDRIITRLFSPTRIVIYRFGHILNMSSAAFLFRIRPIDAEKLLDDDVYYYTTSAFLS